MQEAKTTSSEIMQFGIEEMATAPLADTTGLVSPPLPISGFHQDPFSFDSSSDLIELCNTSDLGFTSSFSDLLRADLSVYLLSLATALTNSAGTSCTSREYTISYLSFIEGNTSPGPNLRGRAGHGELCKVPCGCWEQHSRHKCKHYTEACTYTPSRFSKMGKQPSPTDHMTSNTFRQGCCYLYTSSCGWMIAKDG